MAFSTSKIFEKYSKTINYDGLIKLRRNVYLKTTINCGLNVFFLFTKHFNIKIPLF